MTESWSAEAQPFGRVIVMGAAGFIGSHLCARLLADGWQVTGVDCFTDYYPRAVKEAHLAVVMGHARFTLVEADLLTADLPSLLDGAATIYHLAGQPGVRGSWGNQFEVYARNNILATQRLLEAVLAAGRIPVVYASSSSAYGNLADMPLVESAAPAPVSPYGVTKLAAEHLCGLYAGVFGVPAVALRLFTVYGPGQRPDMAFQRFLTAASQDREITLYGDGAQTRDFTYVEDVTAGFAAAGELCRAGRGQGQVINIAGGSRASVNEVLGQIERLAGHPLRVQHLEAQPGDVINTWADTRRAADLLAFRPQVSLADGLARQWAAVTANEERGTSKSNP
jgi:UDP-glucuronate 4-epimerase